MRTNNRFLLVKGLTSGFSSTLGANFFHKETEEGWTVAWMHVEDFLLSSKTA